MDTTKFKDEMPATPMRHTKGWLAKILMSLLILLSLAALVMLGAKAANSLSNNSAVKSKQYQALFLTNGQVYFGKLSRVTSDYVKITNVFYLQVQQTVQPTDKTKTDTTPQQVSLAKLGAELHAPEDAMYINRSQILFWENLKDSGKVVKAIKDYNNK